jgi:LysM repeat protein
MKRFSPLIFLALLPSCSTTLLSTSARDKQIEVALGEVRLELADIKHQMNASQVEMQILEDKLKSLSSSQGPTKVQAKEQSSKLDYLSSCLTLLEKKIGSIESSQEKIISDLRNLNNHANQTSESLSQYKAKLQNLEKGFVQQDERLGEVAKLKSTLSSLSNAMSKERQANERTYTVQSGDTLGKIAHEHGTTIEAIKKLNRFEKDKIIVGQEIKLPHE